MRRTVLQSGWRRLGANANNADQRDAEVAVECAKRGRSAARHDGEQRSPAGVVRESGASAVDSSRSGLCILRAEAGANLVLYRDESRVAASPSVVVIVLNWCGEQDTVACIESLQSRVIRSPCCSWTMRRPTGPVNASMLASRTFRTSKPAPNFGYAGGNNRGFRTRARRSSRTTWSCSTTTRSWIRCASRRWFEPPRRPVPRWSRPKILYHDAPDVIWYGGGDFSPKRALGLHRREERAGRSHRENRPDRSHSRPDAAFLIRTAVLRKVGGFDESYFAYVEDVELCVRLMRADFTLLYEPRRACCIEFRWCAPPRRRFRSVSEIATGADCHERISDRWSGWRSRRGSIRRARIHFARYVMKGAWPASAGRRRRCVRLTRGRLGRSRPTSARVNRAEASRTA